MSAESTAQQSGGDEVPARLINIISMHITRAQAAQIHMYRWLSENPEPVTGPSPWLCHRGRNWFRPWQGRTSLAPAQPGLAQWHYDPSRLDPNLITQPGHGLLSSSVRSQQGHSTHFRVRVSGVRRFCTASFKFPSFV